MLLTLADEKATQQLGEDLARALKPGDCIKLNGDLGAGKSTLARALIRAVADDDALDVPSPTFTLVQAYDLRIPVAHFDLYRLGDSSELDELGFDEWLETGICLVEWPERAEDRLPEDALTLTFSFPKDGGRQLAISGPEPLLQRVRRSLAIRALLDQNGMAGARRRFLSGDADYRAYDLVSSPVGSPRIVMDSPKRPQTPVIRHGKTYPELVHLAEDCRAFVAIDHLLQDMGATVPAIYAQDLDRGLLLIEDLGSEGVLDADGRPMAERYAAAAACLAHLARADVSREIPVTPDHSHVIPAFDDAAMLYETELLLDWHIPWKLGRQAHEAERQEFAAIWQKLIGLLDDRTHLVLRDVHSPNLLWQAEKEGIQRVGLIDFQDAMIGPAAYDLASLLQDARVTIPAAMQADLHDHYIDLRRDEAGFDAVAFRRDFAIMAAQRNCKLMGLWVRLKLRDNKPDYMRHMDRTLTYISAAFQHEALAPLKDWCARLGLI
ncbi:tRNA (adenosine(37)-N6)-threonylcarbamoyltransferase complex ATPase subunit type 1 TsaE [Allorhizobium sp. BGMRC 0089]|nr:tRNA (adenosine(37)-N6)-threonylcarbamoyltransferase complex ATPase subunit type 1 TsaE [Allorhizobium sonneratiae]